MADDKPEPIQFPIEVVVDNVRVTVTLMLKPGVTAEVSAPEQPDDAARDSALARPRDRDRPEDKPR